jgi:PAS domain S-box-containing protein
MKRILLIDDDDNFRKMTGDILRKNGYEVVEAMDGRLGLEEAKLRLPDLVVCDLKMTGMNGFDVLETLRSDPAASVIPVIIVSGTDEVEMVRYGMAHGADDYVAKPFETEAFLATVQARLKRQEVIQQQVKRQKLILLEILSASQDLVAIALADDLRLTYLNQAGRKLLGIGKDEDISNHRLTEFRPESEAMWLNWAEAIKHGQWSGEVKFRHDGHAPILTAAQVQMHQAEAGIGTHFSILAQDITARRQSEEELQLHDSVLENAANGIVITDRGGVIIWVNQAFTELTGYTSSECLGKKPSILKSGAHDQEYFAELWRTILAGKTWRGELINRRKDGTFYHEEISITPVRDRNGEIRNFIAIKQDISQRKILEKSLAQERDLLQSLMDNIPDCIYFKDAESRYTRINLAQARQLGLKDASEAIGRTSAEFLPMRMIRQTTVEEQCLMATGEPVLNKVEEFELPRGKIWVSTSKVPVRDWSGKIAGLVGVSRDITHLKITEQQLEHERDLLRALMANSPDNIYFKDMKSRFITCSQMMIERFGVSSVQEVVGKSDFDFFGGEHAQAAYDDEQSVIRTGKPIINKVEKESWKLNGEESWALTNKLPLRNQAGEIIGTFGISKNITDMKNAEAAQRNMEVQLRQAQKLEAVGQLAAGIAHEINTPTQYVGDNTRFLKEAFTSVMSVLQSHVEILAAARRNALTPELVQRAEAVLAASDYEYLGSQIPNAINESLEGVDRVSKIVRAMKEFSHPGGKEKQAGDLNKAIESTATVARNEWKYIADLELDLDPGLPLVPCFVHEFNQAMLNLIVNAAHAINDVISKNPGSKGQITIRTRSVGDHAEIRVSDTGTGIAEAHRAHIFEPFFTTKDVGKGTGQGLSIIYASIVKKHGGTVSFETEVGKGTTFIIQLPFIPKGANLDEVPSQLAKAIR